MRQFSNDVEGKWEKMSNFINTNNKNIEHLNIDTAETENLQHEKLLGTTIDSKLAFEKDNQQTWAKQSLHFKGTVMQIKKALINDRLHVSLNPKFVTVS